MIKEHAANIWNIWKEVLLVLITITAPFIILFFVWLSTSAHAFHYFSESTERFSQADGYELLQKAESYTDTKINTLGIDVNKRLDKLEIDVGEIKRSVTRVETILERQYARNNP